MKRTPVSFDASAQLEVVVTVQLSERAARALAIIALYDKSAFLKACAASYGSTWDAEAEEGASELFEVAHSQVGAIMRRADDARAVFKGTKVANHKPQPPTA
jgi:hypothetical protein